MPDTDLPEPAGHDVAPRTYLGWAVAATMLCFVPVGLVAVYYGLRVSRAVGRGQLAAARHDSHVAKGWVLATIAVGLAVYLFIGATLVLLGAFST